MAKAAAPSAGDLLRKPRRPGNPKGSLGLWLRGHPEAVAFLDRWLELRASGESFWSIPDVLDHLQQTQGMPVFTPSGLRDWLATNRGPAYRKATM